MKIPFTKEVPEFKPRPHIGQDTSLTPFQKDMLDALDVLDQRSGYALNTAVNAFNGMLLALGVLGLAILANLSIGSSVLKAIHSIWPAP